MIINPANPKIGLKEIRIKNLSYIQTGFAICGIIAVAIFLLYYAGLTGKYLLIIVLTLSLLFIVFFSLHIRKTWNDFVIKANSNYLFIAGLGEITWKSIAGFSSNRREDDGSLHRGDTYKEIDELVIRFKNGHIQRVNINNSSINVKDLARKLNRFVDLYS